MNLPFSFAVPATCANLGPGYGVLAVALDLPLTITVDKSEGDGIEIDRRGTVGEMLMDERHDPILRGLQGTAQEFKIKLPPKLRVEADSAIPSACGLGTISAAFAAGIATAVRFAKKPPEPNELLDLLVHLGGDPSNGAAALIGGLTGTSQISEPSGQRRRFLMTSHPLHESWWFAFACPNVRIPTSDARRILPPTLPHAVIPRTIGRVLGLLHTLAEADETHLDPCLRDEVHVPFRRHLLPGMDQAATAGREAGARGVTISGHGPGVVALTTDGDAAQKIADSMAEAFRSTDQDVTTLVLRASEHGALPA